MYFKNEKRDDLDELAPSVASNGQDIPSIIAADLRIVGNLICGGLLEIEGEIEGNVTCSKITVRRTGAVKGDVMADEIHVDGEINGLVKGKNITLSESGRVTGVIMYESLSVKDGAYIDGQCKSSDNLGSADVETIEVDDTQLLEGESDEGAEKIDVFSDDKVDKSQLDTVEKNRNNVEPIKQTKEKEKVAATAS